MKIMMSGEMMDHTGVQKMNRHIIKHFLHHHKDVILEKSLINCHVLGMDSVILDDTPGQRIRIFFANENHELYRNEYKPVSLAAHAHHCDLTLAPLWGCFTNIIYLIGDKPKKDGIVNAAGYLEDVQVNEWQYVSEILNKGKGGFKLNSTNKSISTLERQLISNIGPHKRAVMKANDVHTVYVPKGQKAAWVVYEGKEDENYKSVSYTNTDLSRFNTCNLYTKMDEDYLTGLLYEFNLL